MSNRGLILEQRLSIAWKGAGVSGLNASPYIEAVGAENVSYVVPWEAYAKSAWHRPTLVVAPRTTTEVSCVVQHALRDGVALVPAGGGTGYSGGITTPTGGVLLDTQRMSDVLSVDTRHNLVRCQAGIPVARLNQYLEEKGLWWPHNPDSRAMATVGGTISVRGIGTFFTRYGSAPDMVYGLTVVQGDGTVLRLDPRPQARSTGYDLRSLFLASEGTLGIITEAVLKVWPLPEHRRVRLLRFITLGGAERYVQRLFAVGVSPESLLVESRDRIINEFEWGQVTPGHLDESLADAQWIVIISLAGHIDLVGSLERQAVSLAKDCDGALVDDGAIAEAYWWRKTQRLKTDRIEIPTFHVADLGMPGLDFHTLEQSFLHMVSTFHVRPKGIRFYVRWPTGELAFSGIISYDHHDQGAVDRAREWNHALAHEVAGQGGTISSILGVGVRLREELDFERSDVELALMRKIKSAIDPKGIMNPGKLI